MHAPDKRCRDELSNGNVMSDERSGAAFAAVPLLRPGNTTISKHDNCLFQPPLPGSPNVGALSLQGGMCVEGKGLLNLTGQQQHQTTSRRYKVNQSRKAFPRPLRTASTALFDIFQIALNSCLSKEEETFDRLLYPILPCDFSHNVDSAGAVKGRRGRSHVMS